MTELAITTPYEVGFKDSGANEEKSLMASVEARAVAEVQAAYVIAKKFPRNQHAAYMRIIEACKRPLLAEQALYTYPKGGALVSGPSIRLAEVIAQAWGNIEFGVKELTRSNGVSVAEAFAIDLEHNTRKPLIFTVPHSRDKKDKKTGIMNKIKLTDDREIYELVANMGARRLRNCILAVVPPDFVEAAVNQVKKTLESGEMPLSEKIKIIVERFNDVGVKVEHLEKKLGHNLDATTAQEIVTLKGIYKSIKDGFAPREDFFNIGTKSNSAADLQKLVDEKTGKENSIDDKKSE